MFKLVSSRTRTAARYQIKFAVLFSAIFTLSALCAPPVFAQELHYFILEVEGGALANPSTPEVSILRAQCLAGEGGIALDVDGATHTPANALVQLSDTNDPFTVFGSAAAIPSPETPAIGTYAFALSANPAFTVCPSRVTATIPGATPAVSDVDVRDDTAPAPAGIPLELEGPISQITDNGNGTGNITVMGITVQIPATTTINSPTAPLTLAQLADPASLPGRSNAGFIGGTAIIIGEIIGRTTIAQDIFVEPAENVVLGVITSANCTNKTCSNPGDSISILGTPLIRLADARMLAKPPANAFGFELDLSQGALTGVPAAMEGYFGQISTIGDITITSTPALLVQVGTTYIYDVEAIGPGGSLLTYSLDVFPSGMTINSTTGLIGWSPVLADAGTHPITVKVADSGTLLATQSFSITVTTSNTPPVANNDSVDVTSGAASVINVIANDTDADGTIDTASLLILSQPANGIALVNANGTVTYTPNAGFSGIDTFTYDVRDNQGALSNTATVTITVAPAPETVTIDRAIFKATGARWILRGADNPVIQGTTITARLNRTGETIGTSAVSTLGVWSVVVRNSPVIAVAGDTISATSSNGAIIATFPVEVLG